MLTASGQQAVEFTENKGQWDNRVLFRGPINNGAFFLERNGFTVLMHNEADMQQLADRVHGHSHEVADKRNQNKMDAHPRPGHGNGSSPSTSVVLRSHAYRMRFAGADSNATILREKPVNSYENYFIGDDPSRWASGCNIYQAVTYKNVYPNIDVRYYAQAGQLKYDIIVYPGANVNDIVMQYEGADKLQIKKRELYINTSVGEVKELSPYSYQIDPTGKKELDCKYVLEGKDRVKFNIKQYNPSQILVIDPTLIFATFTGSASSQWGFTATYGADGSLYSGGIVFGPGFPVSPGAFQTNYSGGSGNESFDIGIMKFNSSGRNRVYATYIGGSGADQPHSLIEDSQGNLVILGRTNSAQYPLQPAGNQLGNGGNFDIVVTKLNATGTALIGSKRIGGSNMDGVNISTARSPSSLSVFYGDDSRSEVILDNSDNIYLVSNTQSDNFPTTAGASQTAKGGKQDGVLLKIAPDVGTVFFSTLFGGVEDDGTFVLALNPVTNNIYVGGSTRSNNLPGVPGSGVIAPVYQGGVADGFIAVFDNAGTLQKTTYLGTNSMDAIYGLKFDPSGFPYVTGVTLGTWPVSPNVYNNPGTKQFIVKMQPDLSASVYSTVFGSGTSTYNISPVAFAVDKCENVYVAGWGGKLSPSSPDEFRTSGTFGMPTKDCNVLPNGCSTDGSDFYFFVLKKDAQDILFGAFYGQKGGFGDHVDGGTSRFDANGVIYQSICAACFISNFPGTTFPTTPGVWRPRSGNPSECNLAAVKIEMDFSGVNNGIRPSIGGRPYRDYGCAPVTVDFTDTLRKGKLYVWDFGDGNKDTTTVPSTSNTYNTVGNYHVTLISIDSSKCIVSDTAYTTIRVRSDKAQINATAAKLLPCASLNFEFTNTSVAPPGKPFHDSTFTWDFGDGSAPVTTGPGKVVHQFPSPGTYPVKLS
ncbi:MAG TPA: PKD domain-containing protein, partial [Agriterribacter sp.]|nr:PKD domain-containing protein [Agriterribacter sp.]